MKSFLKFITTIIAITFLGISVILTVSYLYLKVSLPSIYKLKHYRPKQTNVLYDIHGNIIAFLGTPRRIFVPLNKIPPYVIHAFIAAEDANFYKHRGIDFLGLLRALYKDIIHGKIVQGGSTITQQVVKSLLLTPKRTIRRKIKEMFLAWQIEKYLTKDQILTIYLNHIYFGEGAYGVEAAALTYFSKHVWQLNLNEAATLAGLPPAPSKYNPIANYKLAIERRNYVLRRMAEVGYISWKTAKKISAEPIKLNPKNFNIPADVAYFVDAVKEELKTILPEDIIKEGGLRIDTTLDLDWQRKATKRAVKTLESLFKKQPVPQLAAVCMYNQSGGVRVLIGGTDYMKSPYNRALYAKRQPGSAFKPFIWAKAIDDGLLLPDSIIPDEPIVVKGVNNGKDWNPTNYDGKYLGPLTLKEALAKSRNTVAVRIALILGLDRIKDMLDKLDLHFDRPINYSIALGAYEVTPLELTRCYTIFPNMGYMVRPHFIKDIYNTIVGKGKLLYKAKPELKKVISPYTAYIMNDFMQAVVNEGTGRCAKALGVPVAGKTGTSQSYRDAWFIGYTPFYTCTVWVGYDEKESLGWGKTGGRIACPVWLSVMSSTKLIPQQFPVYVSPEAIPPLGQ
ncbi:MAG: PBP1A family penicillin-binding protein [Thermodesulfobacteria bacterium]|nr:PBP1A family penicillin-binding protein [Thermodesulfobacteriota bacterium]